MTDLPRPPSLFPPLHVVLMSVKCAYAQRHSYTLGVIHTSPGQTELCFSHHYDIIPNLGSLTCQLTLGAFECLRGAVWLIQVTCVNYLHYITATEKENSVLTSGMIRC